MDSEVQNPTNRYTFHCRQSLPQTLENKNVGLVGEMVMFVHCNWLILIHFVSFCILCGQSVVAIIMIDGSETCNSLVGVEVKSPYMLLKGAVNFAFYCLSVPKHING